MGSFLQRILGASLGSALGGGDRPWRAKTVLLALVIVVAGMGLWLRDARPGSPAAASGQTKATSTDSGSNRGWDFARPTPRYVLMGVSYIGGFFLGWAFRRFLRLAAALAAVALLIVGVGKYAGWNVAPTEARVKESAFWVGQEATAVRDRVKGWLPSAFAGGAGAWLGFRRKGNWVGSTPVRASS